MTIHDMHASLMEDWHSRDGHVSLIEKMRNRRRLKDIDDYLAARGAVVTELGIELRSTALMLHGTTLLQTYGRI
jgi:hypothetical protein